jgi:hypothetical protein
MNTYIPADKLIAEIERQQRKLTVLSSQTRQLDMRRDCAIQNGAYEHILGFITSLQQEQPDKYETALEKARKWMPNVNQGGHAMLIDIFPELGEGLDPRYGGRKQEQPDETCKTCGFYENNCPFIRGKLIPYPNKVCKDYTYSAVKEVEL